MHFDPKPTNKSDIFHFTIRILKFYMLIHDWVYRWSKVLFWIDLQNHHLSLSHCFLWSSSFCLTSYLARSWSASSQMIWSLTDFPQPPLVVSILIRGFHYQGSADVCSYSNPHHLSLALSREGFPPSTVSENKCFKQEWWILCRRPLMYNICFRNGWTARSGKGQETQQTKALLHSGLAVGADTRYFWRTLLV